MSPEELKSQCQSAIESGIDYIQLVMPMPREGSITMRLFGKRGPRGVIICVNYQDRAVVRFKAKSVLSALKILAT